MARPVRIEYPGAVYHVVTRGNNRQAIFKDKQDRSGYLKRLFHYCGEKEVRLLSYCLLFNHVHLLLETPKGNLSKLMQPFQTSYTAYFNRRHERTGHVFEQRYKAYLVDRDSYLLQVSRYIHLNPVEARLVKRPQDYRWSSYMDYLGKMGNDQVHVDLVLGQVGGRGRAEKVLRYRDFVEGGVERGEPWSDLTVSRQAFIGDEEFVESVVRKVGNEVGAEVGTCRLVDLARRICEVIGIRKEDLRRVVKEKKVQLGREFFMYLGRRHSRASLGEIVSWLGARDISTVSHGVRRVEARLKVDRDYRRLMEVVEKKLSYSRIQA